MAKTVCIVGAGPSGLVAAKSLLHDVPSGTFDVTIFDSQPRVGGLWPSSKDDSAGLLHPLMVANQSKHTVQFSDLAWEDGSPEFPRAYQVGHYLDRYFQTYCRDAKLRLGTRVEKAEPLSPEGQGWRIKVLPDGVDPQEYTFDYLLVASGIFSKSFTPPLAPTGHAVPILLHSSQYRDPPSLLGGSSADGGKILVVGGQMSGVEIAGTIAAHLSSASNVPGSSPFPAADKYRIHHITPRPAWVFPLFTSPKPTSSTPPFLPVDFVSYNLANRTEPLTNTQGHITEDAAKALHGLFRTTVGTDQSTYSPAVAVNGDDTSTPPYLAMSDHYLEFVRSGVISVSRGKLESLADRVATISPSKEKVGDIAAVIFATGFESVAAVSFLPPSVLETLSMCPTDLNNTFALAFHGTHHPSLPTLGFVGFYRSPYWGVAEMQARFLTAMWAAGGPSSPSLPPPMRRSLECDSSIDRTIGLRSDPRASQFPMGDYAWLMQEFSTALGMERSPLLEKMPRLPPAGKQMDILTPARYPAKTLSEAQRVEVTKSLEQTAAVALAGLSSTKFVSRAVFRSLLGEWKLERDLISRLPSHPSGHFSGTARFLLREGTRDGRESQFDRLVANGDPGMEYLYVEEGDFKASNGLTFRATRRYIWRYNDSTDRLSVWFAKTDDQKRADYLFHEVDFILPENDSDGKGWKATAGHLCIDDFYDVDYEFRFAAINLQDWRLAYTVKGPKKDYRISGTYTR
ncbi:hypothetical protein QBC34DRAFT_445502 [Podospora aff. communis PSN243]|uniref:DUF6314 domain-containing protein n=1 Tax=Podospora aff. communis PSN243 TaxID=3040156 RepID=A0AAV9H3S7_9PEZI|nr:hypothetical protein QBC34DRAFT_445502 [Podospora aff. communis PSN243]